MVLTRNGDNKISQDKDKTNKDHLPIEEEQKTEASTFNNKEVQRKKRTLKEEGINETIKTIRKCLIQRVLSKRSYINSLAHILKEDEELKQTVLSNSIEKEVNIVAKEGLLISEVHKWAMIVE